MTGSTPTGFFCDICDRPILHGQAFVALVSVGCQSAEHTECRELSEQTASCATVAWYAREHREGRIRPPGSHILHLDEIYGAGVAHEKEAG